MKRINEEVYNQIKIVIKNGRLFKKEIHEVG